MNPNRAFIAIAAGLLAVPEDRLGAAWGTVEEIFRCDTMDLDSGVGAAVGEDGAERMPLRQWIAARRAEGVVAISTMVPVQPRSDADAGLEDGDLDDGEDEDEDEDDEEEDGFEDEDEYDEAEYEDEDDGQFDQHPAHLMAGFAGGMPLLLRLTSRAGQGLYAQGTVSGPRYMLTARMFVQLVAQQAHPEFHWATVLEYLNQNLRCNARDEIAEDELVDHFCSPAGEGDWAFLADLMVREVQVEALTFDQPFVIPSAFADLVDAVRPIVPDLAPPVWLDIEDDEVSGAQLLQLIEAQPFSGRVWQVLANRKLLEDALQDEYDLEEFPQIAPAAWPDYLRRLPDEDVWLISEELVEVVRLECEQRATQPVIPDALDEVFGPDDEQRRRLYFRHRLQHDLGWRVRRVANPSRFYVIDRIDAEVAFDTMPIAESSRAFVAALQAIKDFASRVDSPFVVSFDLALRLVAQAEGHEVLDLTALRERHASQGAEQWESVERSIAPLMAFGWDAERLLGLAAVSAADVFGAMGSWNDQGFSGDDATRFHAVSSELFAALNRYFESLLAFAPGGQVRSRAR